MLDETVRLFLSFHGQFPELQLKQNDRFNSFAASLTQSSKRAAQAFGLVNGNGTVRPWRIALAVVLAFLALWLGNKILGFWWYASPTPPTPPVI